MCQSWANGSAVLEEGTDATQQSPPGTPATLPPFLLGSDHCRFRVPRPRWPRKPVGWPMGLRVAVRTQRTWGGSHRNGGAGRVLSHARRPLLEAPPSEVTAALTGRCASVISFTPPSVPGGRRHTVLVLGIKDLRLQELPRCPAPQSRSGWVALQMRWGPGWGRAASSIIEYQEIKKALLFLQQNVENTPKLRMTRTRLCVKEPAWAAPFLAA